MRRNSAGRKPPFGVPVANVEQTSQVGATPALAWSFLLGAFIASQLFWIGRILDLGELRSQSCAADSLRFVPVLPPPSRRFGGRVRCGHVLVNSNTVISGLAPRRIGKLIVPMPRLTYTWLPAFSYLPLM